MTANSTWLSVAALPTAVLLASIVLGGAVAISSRKIVVPAPFGFFVLDRWSDQIITCEILPPIGGDIGLRGMTKCVGGRVQLLSVDEFLGPSPANDGSK